MKNLTVGDEVEISCNIKISEIQAKIIWGHTPTGEYVCAPISAIVFKSDGLYCPEPKVYGGYWCE